MAIHERSGHLSVWWFPKDFSQSRFGAYRASGTNSCTLISLILADKVSKELREFHRSLDELPRRAVDIFGEAINEGNRVYGQAIKLATKHSAAAAAASSSGHASHSANMSSGSKSGGANATTASAGGTATKTTTKTPVVDDGLNLNIPDALRALTTQSTLGFRLHEWFYTHLQSDTSSDIYLHTVAVRIMQILSIAIHLFEEADHSLHSLESRRYLFAAVIADHRTVIFILELPLHMVTFFDSHQHGRQIGAVIAQCSFEDLYELTYWFVHMMKDIYSSQPSLYEISFLTSNQIRLPQPRKSAL